MPFLKRGSKLFRLIIFLLIIFLFYYYLSQPYESIPELQFNKNIRKFSPDLTPSRLNILLQILYKKELIYESILNKLGVVSFRQLIGSNEASKFLKFNNSNIEIQENFFEDIYSKSFKHSFETSIVKNSSNKDRPGFVIMMAGDHKYFRPLMETIKNVKSNFLNTKMIIYDLGMTYRNKKEVKISSKAKLIFAISIYL